jgi:hypothetical protein
MMGMGIAGARPSVRESVVSLRPSLPAELVVATGGTVTDYTDEDGLRWRQHDFTSTDSFVVTSPGEVELILIGGGGGGAGQGGGGGAAFVLRCTLYLRAATYPVRIGAGGAGGGDNSYGYNGSFSRFMDLWSNGGQGGEDPDGRQYSSSSSASCGGRMDDEIDEYNSPYYEYRGYIGGSGNGTFAGGGGGSTEAGGDATEDAGGVGGAGTELLLDRLYNVGVGGSGGGTDAEMSSTSAPGGSAAGEDGAENTGNGGGGGFGAWVSSGLGYTFTGEEAGNGGSGRCIIRYRIA